MRFRFTLFACLLFFFSSALSAHADRLFYVSDLISTSAPSATSTHRIRFTVTTAVPPSGTIVIRSTEGGYNIPAGIDYTDVDLAVSALGSYVDRPIAASADATNDGIAFSPGTNGSITITMNSTAGLDPGDEVEVEIGSNASFGEVGDEWITNPASTGSYRISVITYTPGSVPIDSAITHIFIISPVGVGVSPATIPPTRSNGLPSGLIAADNSEIEISLETDEAAVCRYSLTSGVDYTAMTETFSSIGLRLHYVVIVGHQNDTTYSYYVRCADFDGLSNDEDYEITFTLDDEATVGFGGDDGTGGVGSIFNGSTYLYQSSVVLSGLGPPSSTVYVLKDGKQVLTSQTQSNGVFTATVSGLERGTYTLSVYAEDRQKRKSSSFSSTLTVGQGTSNRISNILIPPTISLEKETIDLLEDVTVSGTSVPGGSIELLVIPEDGQLGVTMRFTGTTTQSQTQENGAWEFVLPGVKLYKGTYDVKARVVTGIQQESRYSTTLYLGVGENPTPNLFNRSDLNQDGKVNLVDFSILLTKWSTSDGIADINEDGIVNLSDVSIMLFNWTG